MSSSCGKPLPRACEPDRDTGARKKDIGRRAGCPSGSSGRSQATNLGPLAGGPKRLGRASGDTMRLLPQGRPMRVLGICFAGTSTGRRLPMTRFVGEVLGLPQVQVDGVKADLFRLPDGSSFAVAPAGGMGESSRSLEFLVADLDDAIAELAAPVWPRTPRPRTLGSGRCTSQPPTSTPLRVGAAALAATPPCRVTVSSKPQHGSSPVPAVPALRRTTRRDGAGAAGDRGPWSWDSAPTGPEQ